MDRITGEQCRAMRGRLGWTQKELAAAAGVTQTAISQLETGKKHPKVVLDAVRRAFAGESATSGNEGEQADVQSRCGSPLLDARWSLQRSIARESGR